VGHEDGATRAGTAAGGSLTAVPSQPAGGGARIDVVVLCALSGLIIVLAAARRDFLGDGVRHLPAVLSSHPTFGEPRWLLFPPLAWIWVRLLSVLGIVRGTEAALQAMLWMSVTSGIVFLWSIRSWLLVECNDVTRRAAALMLAGSCAPVLILFSDVAEPQMAAAVVACGLAYARRRRDEPELGRRGALIAIGAIALAALIYQGAILALGMMPLVVASKAIGKRRVMVWAGASVTVVFVAMVGAQIAVGTAPRLAVATALRGERNPQMRSLMARPSPSKYLVAIVAGPPQGLLALENFSGVPALLSSLGGGDRAASHAAILNASRLLLGWAVLGIILINGVRTANWRVLAALGVLLILPVLRNQQYGYAKFFILWPIPVALLAIRCRPRSIALAAAAVVLSNTWLVIHDIHRGRELYFAVKEQYGRATPSTCWFTSGWSPPVSYLWPGTAVPVLGMLATGDDPSAQASALTTALRRCFCESDAVWTDSSSRDGEVLSSIARHFAYTSIDLKSVLAEPSELADLPVPAGHLYSKPAQERSCRFTSEVRPDRRRTPPR
jgi:hypothetical protein